MGRLSVSSWLAVLALAGAGGRGLAQRADPPTTLPPLSPPATLPPLPPATPSGPQSLPSPVAEAADRVLPINLATALQLANARPLDVQIAARQVTLAARQLDRAKLTWVPNLVTGLDYFRHDGGQQNFAGEIVNSSRGSFAVGVGPNVVFNLSDAIHAPLAAKQDLRARRAYQQAVANDTAFAVAEAYFGVQQARGELAGATLTLEKAEDAARRAERLAEGLAPPLEASRARVELARRRQAATTARERWRVASAELARLLRLEPGTLVEPLEPPFLTVPVIDPTAALDALVPIGLTSRPELAAHQAVVQAALARLKQEKLRPLVPSVALRSTATNPSGSVAWAGFGGGPNGSFGGLGGRFDLDLQVMWEFQSLGFGNRVRVGERKAEQDVALLELFRMQDRVAAEVTTAFAQVRAANDRLAQSEPALKDALDLVDKSLRGMSQTRRVGETLVLVVRPQEVVAAVQAVGQATADYSAAVSDFNRAQFRLFRALGHPSHGLAGAVPQVGSAVTEPLPPPASAPATRPPQAVSVHPRPSPATNPIAPGRHLVPATANLPVRRGAMPAGQPEPATALRDLPLARYLLARRLADTPAEPAAHREPVLSSDGAWQAVTPLTSGPPVAPTLLPSRPPPLTLPPNDGINWAPIRPADPPVTPPLRWPFR